MNKNHITTWIIITLCHSFSFLQAKEIPITSSHIIVSGGCPSLWMGDHGILATVHEQQSEKYVPHGVVSIHDIRRKQVIHQVQCPARVHILQRIPNTSKILIFGGPMGKDETPAFSMVLDLTTMKSQDVPIRKEIWGLFPGSICHLHEPSSSLYITGRCSEGDDCLHLSFADLTNMHQWSWNLVRRPSFIPKFDESSEPTYKTNWEYYPFDVSEMKHCTEEGVALYETNTSLQLRTETTDETIYQVSLKPARAAEWGLSGDGAELRLFKGGHDIFRFRLSSLKMDPPITINRIDEVDEIKLNGSENIRYSSSNGYKLFDGLKWTKSGDIHEPPKNHPIHEWESYQSEDFQTQGFRQKNGDKRDAWVLSDGLAGHLCVFNTDWSPDIKSQLHSWGCAGSSMGFYACGFRSRKTTDNAWKERFTSIIDERDTPYKDPRHLFHDIFLTRAGEDPDKECIAIMYNGGRIALLDVTTHETMSELVIPGYQTFTLCARNPIKGLIGVPLNGNGLQLLRVTSEYKLEKLAQVWIRDVNTWTIILPDGRYAASAASMSPVYYRKDGQSYPIEDFDSSLNQPDAVAEALGASPDLIKVLHDERKLRLKRIRQEDRKISSIESVLDSPIKIAISQEPPLFHNETHLSLKGVVGGAISETVKIVTYVNDVPLNPVEGTTIQNSPTGAFFDISAPLTLGDNKIQLQAYDETGNRSLYFTRYIYRTSQEKERKRWIIALGVSDYKNDNIPDLDLAAKDAHDIAQELSKCAANFTSSEIILLQNSDVTREKVMKAAERLQASKPEDEIVIFIAGHGNRDADGEFYLCPHDFDVNQPELNQISYKDLELIFQKSQALSRLALIDTCHSGELSADEEKHILSALTVSPDSANSERVIARSVTMSNGSLLATPKVVKNASFYDMRRTCGASVIVASGALECALEMDRIKNGVFTYSIIKSIHDHNTRTDPSVDMTTQELANQVKKSVFSLTQGYQNPEARFINHASQFVVCKAPPKNTDEILIRSMLEYHYGKLSEYTLQENILFMYEDTIEYFGNRVARSIITKDNQNDNEKYFSKSYSVTDIVLAKENGTQYKATYSLNYKMGLRGTESAPQYKSGTLRMLATFIKQGRAWKISSIGLAKHYNR